MVAPLIESNRVSEIRTEQPKTKPLKSCLKPLRSCLKSVDGGKSSPKRRRSKRRIVFGRVAIAEFPRVLGDNPSCSDGAPLTLGWQAIHNVAFELEYYEAYHASEDRRQKNELKLGPGDRSEILLEAGYTMMEIVGATLEVLKAKNERADSYKNRKWDGWNQAIEKTTKTIRKAARRSSVLTATTAEVLISPLKTHKKITRLKSEDKETLSNLQARLRECSVLEV